MADKCPICDSDLSNKTENDFSCDYSCPRCGNYRIEEDLLISGIQNFLKGDLQKIAVLSHWIRSQNESISANKFKRHEKTSLTKELVSNIIEQSPPTPAEQADKFVLWLGNSKNPSGEFVRVQANTHQSIMGAITPRGFGLVLEHLVKTEILNKDNPLSVESNMHLGANVCLSLKGWDRFHQLQRGSTDSRKAFMAMDYSNKTLEKIVNEFFRDAVKSTGFVLFRLDDVSKAGPIDDRLRVEIQTSRFLIADLTDDNPGAYWEAGFAEGLGKPVIYTCEKSKFEKDSTHFDTNHHLTIKWDETNPKEAAEKLKDTIRATLPEAAKLTDD